MRLLGAGKYQIYVFDISYNPLPTPWQEIPAAFYHYNYLKAVNKNTPKIFFWLHIKIVIIIIKQRQTIWAEILKYYSL